MLSILSSGTGWGFAKGLGDEGRGLVVGVPRYEEFGRQAV